MKIVKHKPLLWPLIKLFFPKMEWSKATFTWGDTIYTGLQELPDHVIEHEKVHITQQKGSKLWALIFFLPYALSNKVKLQFELPAYRRQLEVLDNAPAWKRAFAKALSSEAYGNIISYEEAFKLL